MTTSSLGTLQNVRAGKRIRIAVTGTQGQIARALDERAKSIGVDVILVGRPKLDLREPDTIASSLFGISPDAIINAAAYTSVDLAESEELLASKINVSGARAVAFAAAELKIPIVHLSTDYVFDGSKSRPYVETDRVNPQGIYGLSKAISETEVTRQTSDHVILRTAWVYSPFGKNFVRTILRAARTKKSLDVVSDQFGCPTSALDIADGILAVVKNLLEHPSKSDLRGIFHMVGAGDTSWASFAEEVFTISRGLGGPSPSVRHITSAEYPQTAKRPTNSRLDCSLILLKHGIRLPDWHQSLKSCVERILKSDHPEVL